MKRLLCLVISILMVLTLFAGCDGEATKTPSSSQNDESSGEIISSEEASSENASSTDSAESSSEIISSEETQSESVSSEQSEIVSSDTSDMDDTSSDEEVDVPK